MRHSFQEHKNDFPFENKLTYHNINGYEKAKPYTYPNMQENDLSLQSTFPQ